MKIGIDISQLAYPNTGVANYLRNLIKNVIKQDLENQYVLFYSSLRRNFDESIFKSKAYPPNVEVKKFRMPPILLDLMWNKLHKFPIEKFIGNVDIFLTSDWTEPPTLKAKKATILYDLVVYKYPDETARKIIDTQKRKLRWVKKESDLIFCISQTTAKDASDILNIDKNKLKVIYPGIN